MRLFHKIATIYMHPMRITQKYLISQSGHHLPKTVLKPSICSAQAEVFWIQNDHSVTSSCWYLPELLHANLAWSDPGSYMVHAVKCWLKLTAWEYGHVMQCNAEFVRCGGDFYFGTRSHKTNFFTPHWAQTTKCYLHHKQFKGKQYRDFVLNVTASYNPLHTNTYQLHLATYTHTHTRTAHISSL